MSIDSQSYQKAMHKWPITGMHMIYLLMTNPISVIRLFGRGCKVCVCTPALPFLRWVRVAVLSIKLSGIKPPISKRVSNTSQWVKFFCPSLLYGRIVPWLRTRKGGGMSWDATALLNSSHFIYIYTYKCWKMLTCRTATLTVWCVHMVKCYTSFKPRRQQSPVFSSVLNPELSTQRGKGNSRSPNTLQRVRGQEFMGWAFAIRWCP